MLLCVQHCLTYLLSAGHGRPYLHLNLLDIVVFWEAIYVQLEVQHSMILSVPFCWGFDEFLISLPLEVAWSSTLTTFFFSCTFDILAKFPYGVSWMPILSASSLGCTFLL